MFQHMQSAYYDARSTLDPLMRIIADVNNGFNQQPFLRTLATQLDLTSAFNRVEHLSLLEIMDNIGIPSCFGLFDHEFLSDHCFKVRSGNTLSKSAQESCRSPQGTVSSTWIFLICIKSFLRYIVPIAT